MDKDFFHHDLFNAEAAKGRNYNYAFRRLATLGGAVLIAFAIGGAIGAGVYYLLQVI